MELLKLTISPDYTGIDQEPVDADFECFLGCENVEKILTGAGFVILEGKCLLIDKFMDSDVREKYFYVTKRPKEGKNTYTYKLRYFQNDIPLSIKIHGWVKDLWSLAWLERGLCKIPPFINYIFSYYLFFLQ